MSTEFDLEESLEEAERELAGLLTRLEERDADPQRWRTEAHGWAERTRALEQALTRDELDPRLGPRIEALLRLNAVVRHALRARLEETAKSLGRARRARRHLAERGGGGESARSCDVSA